MAGRRVVRELLTANVLPTRDDAEALSPISYAAVDSTPTPACSA
jgi:hypothetical protein